MIQNESVYSHLHYFAADHPRQQQLATYSMYSGGSASASSRVDTSWANKPIISSVDTSPLSNNVYYIILEGLWRPPLNQPLSALLLSEQQSELIVSPQTNESWSSIQQVVIDNRVDLSQLTSRRFTLVHGTTKDDLHLALRGFSGNASQHFVSPSSLLITPARDPDDNVVVPARQNQNLGCDLLCTYIVGGVATIDTRPFVANFRRDLMVLQQMEDCLQLLPPPIWSGKWIGEDAVGAGVSREIFSVYWDQLVCQDYIDQTNGMLTIKAQEESSRSVLKTMARAMVYSISNGLFPGHLNMTLLCLLCSDMQRRPLGNKWLRSRLAETSPCMLKYVPSTWSEYQKLSQTDRQYVEEEYGAAEGETNYNLWYTTTLHQLVYGRYPQLQFIREEIQELLVMPIPDSLVVDMGRQYRVLTAERVVDLLAVAHPRLIYLVGYLSVVVRTYTREKLYQFTRWIHGSRSLPTKITIRHQPQPKFLPSVNTCDGSLWLTHYDNIDQLGLDLDRALDHLGDGMLLS